MIVVATDDLRRQYGRVVLVKLCVRGRGLDVLVAWCSAGGQRTNEAGVGRGLVQVSLHCCQQNTNNLGSSSESIFYAKKEIKIKIKTVLNVHEY